MLSRWKAGSKGALFLAASGHNRGGIEFPGIGLLAFEDSSLLLRRIEAGAEITGPPSPPVSSGFGDIPQDLETSSLRQAFTSCYWLRQEPGAEQTVSITFCPQLVVSFAPWRSALWEYRKIFGDERHAPPALPMQVKAPQRGSFVLKSG